MSKAIDDLKKIINTGIPLRKVRFKAAVDNADDVPESQFSDDSNNRSRRASMWWTGNAILVIQKNSNGEEVYFGVPTSQCQEWKFKTDSVKSKNVVIPPLVEAVQ
jgi:hypothetical protein